MRKLIFLMSSLLLLSAAAGLSQQKEWSLEECVRYAIENNIQIKQQVIQTRYQQNALDLSKLKLLPTLNGQATHNYSFGRALDETTYQYTDQEKVQSNNFYLGGSLSLFRGLQNYNTIQKSKYDLLASDEDLNRSEERR